MSQLIQFGKGVCCEAEISPERQLRLALDDNEQLKDTLIAIVQTAEEMEGGGLIKQLALFGLARSASP